MLMKVYASGGSGNSRSSGIQNLIKGGKDPYGYTDSELKKLAQAHASGDAKLKRQIEARLTDINYHTEASSFSNGSYTNYYGRGLLDGSTPQVALVAGRGSNTQAGVRRAGVPLANIRGLATVTSRSRIR